MEVSLIVIIKKRLSLIITDNQAFFTTSLPTLSNSDWGLKQLREVWTKNFKTSPSEEDDVEMTGDGEGLG